MSTATSSSSTKRRDYTQVRQWVATEGRRAQPGCQPRSAEKAAAQMQSGEPASHASTSGVHYPSHVIASSRFLGSDQQRPRNGQGGPIRASSRHDSSSLGNSSSETSNWTAAATGIAMSAPTTPSKAPPIITATTVTPPGTLTARPMIFGVKR